MNYGRVRQKLKEKQSVLVAMNGHDRTKAEQALIAQAMEPEVKDQEAEEVSPEPKKRGRPSQKAE